MTHQTLSLPRVRHGTMKKRAKRKRNRERGGAIVHKLRELRKQIGERWVSSWDYT